MRVGKKIKLSNLLLTTAILAIAPSIQAQEGSRNGIEINLRQTLRYSDNVDFAASPNEGFYSVTDAVLSYRSITRSDRLEFAVGGGLEYGTEDDLADGLNDPFLMLSYSRENRDAVLSAEVRYREIDVNSTYTETFAGLDFIFSDSGTRANFGAEAGLIFGRTKSLGGEVNVGYFVQDYRDTTSPDLNDQTRLSVNGRLNFVIDPTMTFYTSASFQDKDSDGGSDFKNTTFGIGADIAVNPRLSIDTSINYDRSENVTSGNVEEGIGLSFSATNDMPNGSISANLVSSIDANGRRSSLTATRKLEMRNGKLNFTIGASTSDTTSLQPIVGIDYSRELTERGTLTAGVNQALRTNDEGIERLNTTVDLGYEFDLSRVSRLNAGFTWRDTDVQNGTGDVSRTDASITYSQVLAQDWSVIGGYQYSRIEEESAPTRDSNTIFVGLEKSFDGGF